MISLGLGTTINNRLSSAGFSAEYQAILTAGSAYTQPSSTEQALQNQLILDLKSNGIWAKLDAFYMFANNITDSTGAFARINWKNPSANYGIGAPTLPSISAKNGFTGNGSTAINLQYPANTGTNFASPNGSFGVLLGTVEVIQNPIMAATNATNKLRNTAVTGASQTIGGSSISSGLVPFAANSFVHINVNETTMTVYRNGSGTNGTRVAWVTDTANFYVLRDVGGSFGSSQVKLAFIGGDLSAQASTFNTLISNYITAVNAL